MANSLVNVSVLEASKNSEVLRSIKVNLVSAENSAFKVATKCAWLLGIAIPCGDGTITNKNALKPKAVYTKVEKSKATLSRWIKAVKYIIENNLFNDFNDGIYPFSFDKIIAIFDNELITEERTFADLMAMSISNIEALYKAETEEETEEEAEAETEEETEEEAEAEEEDANRVTFVYDGKTFEVGEKALLKFIETECTLA